MSQSSNAPSYAWVLATDNQTEVLMDMTTRKPYIDPRTSLMHTRRRQVASAPRVASPSDVSNDSTLANQADSNAKITSMLSQGESSVPANYTAQVSTEPNTRYCSQAINNQTGFQGASTSTRAGPSVGEIVTNKRVPPEEDIAGPSNPLHDDFKRRSKPKDFFRAGKVFITPFAEPLGDLNHTAAGTEATFMDPYGTRHFCKVRRFIIIRENSDSCTTLPILTYRGKGCSKRSVTKSDHGIVYTGKLPPEPIEAEKPTKQGEAPMRSLAIRIDVDSPANKLDRMSRICYAKTYTIDHRVRVKAFGTVNKDSWFPLISQFEKVWVASLGGSRGRCPPPEAGPLGQKGSNKGQQILQTVIDEKSRRSFVPEPTPRNQMRERRSSQNQSPQWTDSDITKAAVAVLRTTYKLSEQEANNIVISSTKSATQERGRLSVSELFEVLIQAIARQGGGDKRAREALAVMIKYNNLG